MGKEYIYHNFIWKSIYGNINTNRIFPRFKKDEQFRSGFNWITHNSVGLANYTIKNSETKLYLSIKDIGEEFEFISNWIATKMKGAFLETIFDEIVNQNKIENDYIKKNFIVNLEKYDKQQEILGTRNSYSKTDTDATFMRMKEDHMLNGQLKPGYNQQISTENQVIVHYTTHQNPTDTKTLKPHLEDFKETFGQEIFKELKEITADAGYGSEENYDYLEKEQLTAFVKYNTFDKEQDKRYQQKNKPFSKENLYYNQEEDYYICPMGQKMLKTHQTKRTTEAGYSQNMSHYQPQNCEDCPLRNQCFKAKGNRSIERNHNLERHKQKTRELLLSQTGIQKRKQRTADVEPVFAQLKHNHHFRRLTLKGIKKVDLEFGLMAIAHNLRKKIAA